MIMICIIIINSGNPAAADFHMIHMLFKMTTRHGTDGISWNSDT